MSDIRKRVELFFESLSRKIYRNAVLTLLLMGLFIGGVSQFARNLTVDTATEAMLHKTDPSLLAYNAFRNEFGRSELVAILVEAPDIFNRHFLMTLKALHEDLEHNVPYLKKVTSLINVRNTYGENNILHVEELVKHPETADIKFVKSRALATPLYENYILSADKKSTALIIETVSQVFEEPETAAPKGDIGSFKKNDDTEDFATDDIGDFEKNDIDGFGKDGAADFNKEFSPPPEYARKFHYISAKENEVVNTAVKNILKKYRSDTFKPTFSGGSVVVDVFNKATARDTTRLVKIMLCVILGFLFLMFRRVSGMILPIVIVSSSTLTTLGLMGLTGTPISIMTNILPAFLVSVCIADAVHVLAIFYREFQKGESRENAICHAMGHSGLAIVMTSLTTAAGLLSFSFAEIATIGELGYFSSIGVMLGLVYTIILLPALLSVIPIVRKPEKHTEKASLRMDRFLLFFGNVSIRHPYKIIAISVFFMVVSIVFILKLQFSSFVLTYFPKKHQVKLDLQHLEENLGGSITFEALVDTHRENGIQDPVLLHNLDALIPLITQIKTDTMYVGKVISIIDVVKETNQALNNNAPEAYTIPDDPKAVAQEMLLFENSGPDELKKLCDTQFSKTRLTIKTKWTDSVVYKTFVNDLTTMFQNALGDQYTVTITGLAALMARTIPAALVSMAESYVIALIVITIFMIFLVGDLKLGMISMFPNLLPIFMVFGLISIMGVKLDINTLFIGSVAIGLVVDDTIHFIYNFKKYFARSKNAETAIRETFLGTGRALLITSIVLSMNFFVLLFSTLNHSMKFGFFTGISIIFALMADFFLSPALLYLVSRNKQWVISDEPDTEPTDSRLNGRAVRA